MVMTLLSRRRVLTIIITIIIITIIIIIITITIHQSVSQLETEDRGGRGGRGALTW
jgi:hypothetical protein